MEKLLDPALTVKLGDRSYPIYIEQGLFANKHIFDSIKSNQKVMIITNTTIEPLYLESIKTCLKDKTNNIQSLAIPDGEQFKSLETSNTIFTSLLEQNFSRDSILIALGGGVIGDLVGFAAACYQRGIDFIQIPTTLLSQVDSSVGGKTAVNHPLGKNMIGAFYQPQSVIIDINCLSTLPAREFSAGIAEVIKYGIIFDSDFFNWLERHIEKLMALDPVSLKYAIKRCCELKAEVVERDEKEQGDRALLNLGHTFGHAIEAQMGYGNWLHGEAVSVGMLMACETAIQLGCMKDEQKVRIQQLLAKAKLPIKAPDTMPIESYMPHMMRDKKVLAGKLRLVIPIGIGQATVKQEINQEIVIKAIESCL
ncbi:3-dehydroquinate synthase [Thorsellia anophelis]|uniref:3-dehydroquinate synthase n=1 Tax=Thorsellia anophelis DSM 18579 TaxID=1123402 RepID=A0A1H9Y662_9GAMM|nr:3-dehydroquinate synthase [Thorsellia anophelis]SES63911.1 3-dehydroquinate synthase [Thorsellia anophelis DSM 18579]